MKKKTMVLGGLIAAVAITGYSVAGTYAKYVSSSTQSDSAKVAKWMFEDGETKNLGLFADTAKIAVNPATGDRSTINLIAPGSTGSKSFEMPSDKSITGGVNGNEVHYNFTVAVTGDEDDIKIPVTETADQTAMDGFLDADDNYYPVVFTLSVGGTAVDKTDLTTSDVVTLTDIVAYLNDEENNQVAGKTVEITWKWEFEQAANKDVFNKYDSAIGRTLSDKGLSLDISVTAEQTTTAGNAQ